MTNTMANVALSASEHKAFQDLRHSIRGEDLDPVIESLARIEITGLEILKGNKALIADDEESFESFARDSVKLLQEHGSVQGPYNIRMSRRMSNCSSLGMEESYSNDLGYQPTTRRASIGNMNRRSSIGSQNKNEYGHHHVPRRSSLGNQRRSSIGAMRRSSIGSIHGSIHENHEMDMDAADIYGYGSVHVPRRSSLGGAYNGRRTSTGQRRMSNCSEMDSVREALMRAPRRSSLCSDYGSRMDSESDYDSMMDFYERPRRRMSNFSDHDSMKGYYTKDKAPQRVSNDSNYVKMKRRLSEASQMSGFSADLRESQHSHCAVPRAA